MKTIPTSFRIPKTCMNRLYLLEIEGGCKFVILPVGPRKIFYGQTGQEHPGYHGAVLDWMGYSIEHLRSVCKAKGKA